MSQPQAKHAAGPIIVESLYPVSPERAYGAWTDPNEVKQWFGSQTGDLYEATIDLRPGGKWCFTEHCDANGSTGFAGEYLKIAPNELLVFTWTKVSTDHNGRHETTPSSKVEICFVATNGGTKVRVVHSELDPKTQIEFRAGWTIGAASLEGHLRR